jgi:SecD/SecF fusion protein
MAIRVPERDERFAARGTVLTLTILLLFCLAASCGALGCSKAKNRVQIVLELDRTNVPSAELDSVMDRTVTLLNERVKQFGVRGQTVQREGESRIVVDLPVKEELNEERIERLFGRSASLEFIIVKTEEETGELLERLDSFVAARVPAATDTAQFPHIDPAAPISSRMLSIQFGGGFFAEADVPYVQRFMAEAGADTLLPLDARLSWSAQIEYFQGKPGMTLYFLNKTAELTGAEVEKARVVMGLNPNRRDAPGVLLTFTKAGAITFSEVTGANVGRQLAIVLDGKVTSSPVIRQKIPSGEASIIGDFSENEAQDLAICLRAGALPAPISVVEVRRP